MTWNATRKKHTLHHALKPTPQVHSKQRIRVCLPLPHTALQLVHSCHSPTWQSVSLGPPQGLVSLLACVNGPSDVRSVRGSSLWVWKHSWLKAMNLKSEYNKNILKRTTSVVASISWDSSKNLVILCDFGISRVSKLMALLFLLFKILSQGSSNAPLQSAPPSSGSCTMDLFLIDWSCRPAALQISFWFSVLAHDLGKGTWKQPHSFL